MSTVQPQGIWIETMEGKKAVNDINHENVVYLLCINWSHFKVIKRYRLTGTVIYGNHTHIHTHTRTHHTAID